MWRPFVVEGAVGPATPLRIEPDPNWGWSLHAGDEHLGSSPDPWFLAAELRFRLVRDAIERSDALLLHASVVSREGRALVAMADSGGGKTTLSLALAESGWDYHGDDVAAIDPESLEVTAVPTPAGIRDLSRWDELSPRWGDAAPWAPSSPFLVPAVSFIGGVDSSLPAGALAFLEFAPEGEPALERISAAEATVLCTAQGARPTPRGVAALSALCRRAPCVRLRYPSSSAALALLDDMWSGR